MRSSPMPLQHRGHEPVTPIQPSPTLSADAMLAISDAGADAEPAYALR